MNTNNLKSSQKTGPYPVGSTLLFPTNQNISWLDVVYPDENTESINSSHFGFGFSKENNGQM